MGACRASVACARVAVVGRRVWCTLDTRTRSRWFGSILLEKDVRREEGPLSGQLSRGGDVEVPVSEKRSMASGGWPLVGEMEGATHGSQGFLLGVPHHAQSRAIDYFQL